MCVVGLGYVGLPLASSFSHYFNVVGFDVNKEKIAKIKKNHDTSDNNNLNSFQEFNYNKHNLLLTSEAAEIKNADVVIIAVPTPVTKSKQPDMSYIHSAGEIVGKHLKKDAIVVLESTVYPGTTEEELIPILERSSNMICGVDFKVGYSPERVNPGDEEHTIDKITKIVSAIDEETLNELAEIYGLITTVYRVKDIKTAEAAKVIENIQRDLNIALVNELSIIFDKLHINSKEVLDAAATKWNFHHYHPGLVGGHCIPVDPYYLVYKAKELGYHPQVILAGRAVNDNMAHHVVELCLQGLNEAGKPMNGSKVLIMGLTYKENIDDTRENPVKTLIHDLRKYNCEIYGYDPNLTKKQIEDFYIIALDSIKQTLFDCVIMPVVHDEFKSLQLENIRESMTKKPVFIDIRGKFRKDEDVKNFIYKTL
ncbi:MAG: nucleotide sugar dehydrogenase [Candidatus Thermoplasmatota archaeon]|nr:nucleotide sugar dehydrogenase [Candidatus Thermoplasmatota archaeon]